MRCSGLKPAARTHGHGGFGGPDGAANPKTQFKAITNTHQYRAHRARTSIGGFPPWRVRKDLLANEVRNSPTRGRREMGTSHFRPYATLNVEQNSGIESEKYLRHLL